MSADMRHGFEWLQAELESSRLEVVLVPCRREVNCGGCIRVAASRNAAWYRQLCNRYASGRFRRNRAFDTRIKRANIARILARLVDGKPSRSRYVADLERFAARVVAQSEAVA
ncbi:hypothetical protein [Oleiharenicola sp. Vm1]|uniref:hypothetical protein n=1 Tax=Oleiharenicola sp. Vm1 TaxID=3398393 RepID=UPI0039F5F766